MYFAVSVTANSCST